MSLEHGTELLTLPLNIDGNQTKECKKSVTYSMHGRYEKRKQTSWETWTYIGG